MYTQSNKELFITVLNECYTSAKHTVPKVSTIWLCMCSGRHGQLFHSYKHCIAPGKRSHLRSLTSPVTTEASAKELL